MGVIGAGALMIVVYPRYPESYAKGFVQFPL